MEQIDRYRGCLLGLAVGDAVGTALEFSRPGSFQAIDDMVGGGPFGLRAGEWTDDTSMALCLAASLVECNGFDPRDQMERYLRWYREGYMAVNGRCFDIGMTVRAALHQYDVSGEPFSGPTAPNTAGNGSLMRLAPVPMFYANQPAEAIEKSGLSSRTTHGAPQAIDACRYFGGMITGALNGAGKEDLLSPRFSPLKGFWETHPLSLAVDQIAAGSFKTKEPPEIRGTGYVVEALEAALWAFYRSASFEEGCLKAVNLGGDADTTGAIYGQIAGAFYGSDGIPRRWLEKLAWRETLERHARLLYESQAS